MFHGRPLKTDQKREGRISFGLRKDETYPYLKKGIHWSSNAGKTGKLLVLSYF